MAGVQYTKCVDKANYDGICGVWPDLLYAFQRVNQGIRSLVGVRRDDEAGRRPLPAVDIQAIPASPRDHRHDDDEPAKPADRHRQEEPGNSSKQVQEESCQRRHLIFAIARRVKKASAPTKKS
jgi:hypothetical protein